MNWTLFKFRIVTMVFMLIISIATCINVQNVSRELAFGYCMIAISLSLVFIDGIFYLKAKNYKMGICWGIASIGLYIGITGISLKPGSSNMNLFFAFSFIIGLLALLISIRFKKSDEEK